MAPKNLSAATPDVIIKASYWAYVPIMADWFSCAVKKDALMRWISREGVASVIFIKLEIKVTQMILKRTGRFIYAVSEDALAMLLLMRGFAMGT
mmetsp:Transcript_27208/g.40919  ORF Transcript_27208/g.40919 Transcript_27208/m.40919 type:complete len:94 (-) Transcript_27208:83-364(-)